MTFQSFMSLCSFFHKSCENKNFVKHHASLLPISFIFFSFHGVPNKLQGVQSHVNQIDISDMNNQRKDDESCSLDNLTLWCYNAKLQKLSTVAESGGRLDQRQRLDEARPKEKFKGKEWM